MAGIGITILKEGKRRKLSPFWKNVVAVLVLLFAAMEFYGAPFGFIDSFVLRGMFVGFILALTFISYTPTQKSNTEKVPVADIILAAIGFAAGLYVLFNGQDIITRWTGVDPLTLPDILVTSAFVLLVLEVTRRTVGPVLLAIILVFIAYNFVGQWLPGYFGHRGMSLIGFLDRMVYTFDGIFGTPIGVTCTYVFMFMLFGQVFNASGGGDFFFRLAASIAGRARGGPAKIAVIASALYGTVSGSPTSDVVTTGSITIPLMKRVGYTDVFSGGVEAAASAGASILPPIMGTAAFLMVDVAGIPYIEIALASAIPAIIYYFGIMMQVHYRAITQNLPAASADAQRESPVTVIKENWIYLIPIGALIFLIIQRINPTLVGLISVCVTIVVSWFKPGHRIGPKGIYKCIHKTGTGILTVANASAAAGMVVGGIMLTGLGGKFTSLVFAASGGNSLLCLCMVAIVCIILGMGMPIPAAYILTATLAVPALLELKFSLMASHLFIVYFSAVSAITPPVAVAAYSAAGIAGGNPNTTGFVACRLAVAAYLAPFVYMYRPGLILHAGLFDIIWATLTTFLAVWSLAAGLEGYFYKRTENLGWRALLIFGGLVFIWPAVWADIIGFIIFFGILAYQYFYRRSPAGAKAPEPAS